MRVPIEYFDRAISYYAHGVASAEDSNVRIMTTHLDRLQTLQDENLQQKFYSEQLQLAICTMDVCIIKNNTTSTTLALVHQKKCI